MIAPATLPPTRDRLLDAALELFAERGFAATTVGDIEAAAGLAPRAGGLYKHFENKEAVLRAALERFISGTEAAEADVLVPFEPGRDLRAELTAMANATIRHLRGQRLFMRIVFQERPRFPDLIDEMYRRGVAPVYPATTAWLDTQVAAGVLPPCDTEALAVALLIPFVGYRVEHNLFGVPPGGVDEERFAAAWVDLVLAYANRGENDGDA
jgi:AcrR family transcriptional regulator